MSYSEKNAQAKTEEFFRQFPLVRYKKGRDLILWSDEPKSLYFLESGHVRQYDIAQSTGKTVTIHLFHPGSFFPLVWTLSSHPTRFFYAALTDVAVRPAPIAAVTAFLLGHPEATFFLTTRLAGGLGGLSKRLKLLILEDARTQILSELLYLAEHFGEKSGRTVVIHHQFTHQQIADLTGLARETVSHMLEAMVKEGLIAYDQHFIVLKDLPRLRQEIPW